MQYVGILINDSIDIKPSILHATTGLWLNAIEKIHIPFKLVLPVAIYT